MSVADNIKAKRLEKGLSQQELADKLGYKTRSTITKIESGENNAPEIRLSKFAWALDTSISFLKTGIEDLKKEKRGERTKGRRNIAIILAGGTSSRNMQNIPNQFINVLGKPVIVYCLEAYQHHPAIDEVYVVCLKNWGEILEAYAEQYGISKLKGIIPGGESGVLSVRNGVRYLDTYSEEDVVIFQEATRPLVTEEIISNLLRGLKESDCAIVVEPMNDYIQFITDNKEKQYVDRKKLVSLQSPEAYTIGLIRSALAQAENEKCNLEETTCSMMLYNLGYKLTFVDGNHCNIKIVRQEDLAVLSALLKNESMR